MVELFDENFCSTLEYRLSRLFKKSDKKEIRSLWCDGIFPAIGSGDNPIDSRLIRTKAWIGKDGQEEYSMKILLGYEAIILVSNGESPIEAIPNEEADDWIDLDTDSKTISVQLN